MGIVLGNPGYVIEIQATGHVTPLHVIEDANMRKPFRGDPQRQGVSIGKKAKKTNHAIDTASYSQFRRLLCVGSHGLASHISIEKSPCPN
jgi:hypothetical protein